MLPNGFRRRVGAVACCACQRPEDQGLVTGNDLDTTDTDAAGGEGARLVEAQAVHAGEDLDGGQLLDEHATTGQGRRTDREVHRRQQHKALRDHADHGCDRANESLAPVSPVTACDAVLRVERQDDDGQQHDGDNLQHAVDRHLNFGHRAREGARLLGQALRVDALADGSSDHAARPSDDTRARQQLIALLLLHGA